MKALKILLEVLAQFGFKDFKDFYDSTLKPNSMLVITLSGILALAVTVVEKWLGIPLPLFTGFLLLIVFEFYTGVTASVKEGENFYSRKAGRIILKVGTYSGILGILNLYKNYEVAKTGIVEGVFSETGLYIWLYWFVFHLISLQLLRSVFENLHRIGYEETSIISKIFKSKVAQIFKVLTEAPNKNSDNQNKEKEDGTK